MWTVGLRPLFLVKHLVLNPVLIVHSCAVRIIGKTCFRLRKFIQRPLKSEQQLVMSEKILVHKFPVLFLVTHTGNGCWWFLKTLWAKRRTLEHPRRTWMQPWSTFSCQSSSQILWASFQRVLASSCHLWFAGIVRNRRRDSASRLFCLSCAQAQQTKTDRKTAP